jgi:replication-associated recombination protein RarA
VIATRTTRPLRAALGGVVRRGRAAEGPRSRAKRAGNEHGERTILFVDEIHRWSKSQQDALLGAVERGSSR